MRDPIHPGETLREDLDALGMSAAELARRIEVPVNASPRYSMLNARSPAIPHCVWAASSAHRGSSGSTFRSSTNCGGRNRRTVLRSPCCRPWIQGKTCTRRDDLSSDITCAAAPCCFRTGTRQRAGRTTPGICGPPIPSAACDIIPSPR